MDSTLFYLLLSFSAFALTVIALPFLSSFPLVELFVRSFVSWIAIMACGAYGTLAAIVLRIPGYEGLTQWTTALYFKWTLKYLVDVEFVVQNPEYLSTRPIVIIGNHQTYVKGPDATTR